MKNWHKLFFLFALTTVFVASSCREDNPGGTACSSDFDQSVMLAAYADGLIMPNYQDFRTKAADLEGSVTVVLQDPTTATVSFLREQLLRTIESWQRIEAFNFGPAGALDLRAKINPFPVNEALVDELVNNGIPADYNFTFDQGLPALEYFLFSGTLEETVARLQNTGQNANARQFLVNQAAHVRGLAVDVHVEWENGYRETFVANTGTAAGTGVSQLINGLNEHWENTKRDRIGIPSGVATLGFTNPESVEYPYSGKSLDMLKIAAEANREMYRNGSRSGLDDYLVAINAQKNGESLNTLINNQYEEGLEFLNEIEGPLAEAVDNDGADVTAAYGSLVRNIVLLKTDMPSLLCVAITYVDNPSDSD